jgi:hypothetical protein
MLVEFVVEQIFYRLDKVATLEPKLFSQHDIWISQLFRNFSLNT